MRRYNAKVFFKNPTLYVSIYWQLEVFSHSMHCDYRVDVLTGMWKLQWGANQDFTKANEDLDNKCIL